MTAMGFIYNNLATDTGKRFIEAWKRARIIVDTSGGHANGNTPPQVPK